MYYVVELNCDKELKKYIQYYAYSIGYKWRSGEKENPISLNSAYFVFYKNGNSITRIYENVNNLDDIFDKDPYRLIELNEDSIDDVKYHITSHNNIKKNTWVCSPGKKGGKYYYRYKVKDSDIYFSYKRNTIKIENHPLFNIYDKDKIYVPDKEEMGIIFLKLCYRIYNNKHIYILVTPNKGNISSRRIRVHIDTVKVNFYENNNELLVDNYTIYHNGEWAKIAE